MLVTEYVEKLPSDGFVMSIERGAWAQNNRVMYYKIEYNDAVYSDSLYDQYGVALPSAILRGVRKRRAEYLAGRICCQQILQYAGIRDEVRSQFPDRAPIWPSQVNGSITHCRNYAMAVICPREWGYVGVDIEYMDEHMLTESAEVICPGELTLTPQQLLLNFSAKESLFKALYPQVNIYFGFEYADLEELDRSSSSTAPIKPIGSFRLRLTRYLYPGFDSQRSWVGSYAFEPKSGLMTTLVLDPHNR